MLRRVTWLALLAVLLVLAGGGSGRSRAAERHRPATCDAMAMLAGHAAPAHKEGNGACRTCGIDCPMHCAALGMLPTSSLFVVASRAAYPPCAGRYANGWPPNAEHGPPRPLA